MANQKKNKKAQLQTSTTSTCKSKRSPKRHKFPTTLDQAAVSHERGGRSSNPAWPADILFLLIVHATTIDLYGSGEPHRLANLAAAIGEYHVGFIYCHAWIYDTKIACTRENCHRRPHVVEGTWARCLDLGVGELHRSACAWEHWEVRRCMNSASSQAQG